MSYRTFVDEQGVSWQVWEVRPARVERRMRERRIAQRRFEGPDRRRAERRTQREQRVYLGPELASGWLAFHSAGDKRRFAPIPEGWEDATHTELITLCRNAKPVRPGGPTFSSGGGSGGTGTEPPGFQEGRRRDDRAGGSWFGVG